MTHLWIVTHLNGSPSVDVLAQSARDRGMTVDVVRARLTHIDLASTASALDRRLFGAESGITAPPDRVITRLGSSAPPHAHDLVRAIEASGCPVVNSSHALAQTTDKIRSFEVLRAAGLPLPPTMALGTRAALAEVEARLGPAPWVLKLPVSFQGIGVAKIDSASSLRSTVDLLRQNEQRLLLQSFVAEAAGSDLRVLVLGGRAVAAMRRQGAEGDFRSNLHRGGSAHPEALTAAIAEVAERAAAALGLGAAGVDLIVSDAGPLVIEVNASPGLVGIQTATEVNVAGAFLDAVFDS